MQGTKQNTETSVINAEAINGCIEVCSRCRHIAEALSQTHSHLDTYQHIGPHIRHCIDHFSALLDGLSLGEIDYDARQREKEIEQIPEVAIERLDAIVCSLESLLSQEVAQGVSIAQLASGDSAPSLVGSTIDRELIFLCSHTIHHIALIIEIAARCGVTLPAEYGLAYSTARYLSEQESGQEK